MKKRVLLLALGVSCLGGQSLAAEKIEVSDEVRKVLDDNYRLYRENNARKVAEKETVSQMSHSQALLQSAEAVSLPICELDRAPANWKYITPSEDKHILKYVGAAGASAQFLKWTDSVWVRLSGSKDRFREGMYCGEGAFAAIDLDDGFAQTIKYKSARQELTEGTVLQLASKVLVKRARTMQAELTLASDTQTRIGLEMWQLSNGNLKLVSSTWGSVGSQQETLKIEGEVDAMHETFVVARLDPSVARQTPKDGLSGRLIIFGASVRPK